MEPPSAKRQRTENGHKSKHADIMLQGVKIYVAEHVHNRKTRLRIWERQLGQHGGIMLSKASPDATHAVVETASADVEALPKPVQTAQVVTPEWLTDSLAAGQRQPESQYKPEAKPADFPVQPKGHPFRNSVSEQELSDGGASDSEIKYGRWLGHWDPALDDSNQLALMMHAVYSVDRCRKIGNEAVCKALNELYKYEMAVDSDRPDDDRHHEHVNFRALGYSRGAAAVMACSYPITDRLQSSEIPYMGASLVKKVQQIAATGTCEQLEQFRNDELVTDHSGEVRKGTEGGRTRAMFIRLPGVGARMAHRWWQLGFGSFEDVEAAAGPGGSFQGKRNNVTISHEAHFSLMHRGELLEKVPVADVEEMREAASAALGGSGWRLVPVGGGARGRPSHDCDFIVTHDYDACRPAGGMLKKVVDELLKQGRLWPGSQQGGEAMLRVQTGRMAGHRDRMKAHVAEDVQATKAKAATIGRGRSKGSQQGASNLIADRYDHVFGMFKTAAGKARRLDLIFVPHDQLPFGYLGWVGSRQFLRFMRTYANELHMHLNAHALVTKTEQPYLVPDEGPPLNRAGVPEWPPGWTADRRVEHESDIFELLRIPYHAPHERNCP